MYLGSSSAVCVKCGTKASSSSVYRFAHTQLEAFRGISIGHPSVKQSIITTVPHHIFIPFTADLHPILIPKITNTVLKMQSRLATFTTLLSLTSAVAITARSPIIGKLVARQGSVCGALATPVCCQLDALGVINLNCETGMCTSVYYLLEEGQSNAEAICN